MSRGVPLAHSMIIALVSQILGDPLDYDSVSVLSRVVIRIYRFGFGVWRPLALT